jgi:tetratricopeptide (TPR) repeat protein
MGIILGTVLALTTFVLITRRLAKQIEPAFEQIGRQLQSGATQAAISSLEELLPRARWQVMLAGQIHAQLGIVAYATDKDDLALEHLSKAGLRVPDAQLARAALLYRRKKVDEAKEVLDVAIRANKKQILLYHVHAFILAKEGEREAAIEQLQKALKVEPSSESTKDNLLRLQNGKKLNMKRFGTQWYTLKLEKLPASMRQGHVPGPRKGFRNRAQRGR